MSAWRRARLSLDQPVELKVDHARRRAIRANHSATHLLHEALRQVLGDHVAQKGSLVSPDRLRFDISHPKPIEADELARVEDIANAVLLQNAPVVTKLMAVDDAIASGARALFGEKYGDEVRVVSMGLPVDGRGRARGGPRTSPSNSAAAPMRRAPAISARSPSWGRARSGAGVRRIEALTADAARHHRAEEARTLAALAGILKAPVSEAPDRLTALMEDRRRLERELAETRRKLAMGGEGGPGSGRAADPRSAASPSVARWSRGSTCATSSRSSTRRRSAWAPASWRSSAWRRTARRASWSGVTDDLTGRYDAVGLVRAGAGALGRQGRRRPPRHGAGRRPERGRGRGGPRRHRSRLSPTPPESFREADGRTLSGVARRCSTGPVRFRRARVHVLPPPALSCGATRDGCQSEAALDPSVHPRPGLPLAEDAHHAARRPRARWDPVSAGDPE